jgi:hypothetical protein
MYIGGQKISFTKEWRVRFELFQAKWPNRSNIVQKNGLLFAIATISQKLTCNAGCLSFIVRKERQFLITISLINF